MPKDKAIKAPKKKSSIKKEGRKVKLKNKEDKNSPQKKIDEQNSDGSGGAFEEFIDQRRGD
jgi:hypothetical protein